jgi:hypothetical protein
MGQHTLVLHRTLLNNHTCYSLISSRKLLSRLLNLHVAVEVCASCSRVILPSLWKLIDHTMYKYYNLYNYLQNCVQVLPIYGGSSVGVYSVCCSNNSNNSNNGLNSAPPSWYQNCTSSPISPRHTKKYKF